LGEQLELPRVDASVLNAIEDAKTASRNALDSVESADQSFSQTGRICGV